ncbi:MAG TPA: DUF499 domain-containing protein, partial [Bryobacteraceae bacterium]|nr:DUF499 domain-containing protein [Bryobacteraceae bacterium]
RYWYATQPTVAKLAADRAEELKRHRDKVLDEIRDRIRDEIRDSRKRGEFVRVHAFPGSSAEVSDERSTALVILGPETEWSKEAISPALAAAKNIFDMRGTTPRIYKNAVVFLAADRVRLEELEQAVRNFLAWKSILDDAEGDRPSLNLDNFQRTQASAQRKTAEQTVHSRIAETYQTVLAPSQDDPQAQISWKVARASGTDGLAVRAWKKLKSDGALVADFAGSILRLDLDRVLWRGDSVTVRQLMDDYASYPYLQRLRDPSTLAGAIADGIASMTWVQDGFAYADAWDESAQRHRGLRSAQNVTIREDDNGVLVRPEVALKQLEAERVATAGESGVSAATDRRPEEGATKSGAEGADAAPAEAKRPKRFHATVSLNPERVGRDASQIADEVISHLTSALGADVTVTLEIEAQLPGGASEQVVRTVTENCKSLKFDQHGFESE